ncbi:unnamed protein product [Brassicogethes aeneus]|uniref:BED-type domain-containing protein n=1 Tax=Brassicogethes aeneus TaxID=1431903 RepID=A0A9P0BCN7_BRAAE|nr:unnamed protein product [Brassicogethes aeneus]
MSSRNRSFARNYFTKISFDKAKCDMCLVILSIKGGSTTNLIRHTKTKHPGVDLDNLKKKVPRNSRSPLTLPGDTEVEKQNQKEDSNTQEPSTSTANVNKWPISMNNKNKNDTTTATAVAITTDGWTSLSNYCYLALTVHFINENCELRTFLLDCFKYNERHTAENLAAETKRVLIEWGVYEKIVALVTDNAANMSATARLGGWKHLPCFAHSINLVVLAGLKEIHDTHVKVKGIVEFFKRSPQSAEKLRAVEEQMCY